jgi:hypothetical protein
MFDLVAEHSQNRFQELQDDFLLQCYFRMKRIEREMRYQEVDATDDEVSNCAEDPHRMT